MTAGNVAYLLVATAILATLVFFVGRTIRDIVRIAKSKPSEPGDWFWAIFIALLILIGLVLGVGPGPFDIPMSSIVKHVPYSD